MMDNHFLKNNKSITEFLKISKPDRVKEKKERKQQIKQNAKKSTQLSLLGWLLKDRPRQNCKLYTFVPIIEQQFPKTSWLIFIAI